MPCRHSPRGKPRCATVSAALASVCSRTFRRSGALSQCLVFQHAGVVLEPKYPHDLGPTVAVGAVVGGRQQVCPLVPQRHRYALILNRATGRSPLLDERLKGGRPHADQALAPALAAVGVRVVPAGAQRSLANRAGGAHVNHRAREVRQMGQLPCREVHEAGCVALDLEPGWLKPGQLSVPAETRTGRSPVGMRPLLQQHNPPDARRRDRPPGGRVATRR
jgi:hypothetical protein